jgi:hypothetical protein
MFSSKSMEEKWVFIGALSCGGDVVPPSKKENQKSGNLGKRLFDQYRTQKECVAIA